MKKIKLSLSLISLFAIGLTSCKKSSSGDPVKDPAKDPAAQYYITYKANGTAVSETEVSGSRGASATPRTLTITGTAKSGAAPKFKFTTQESFIGFVKGLTVVGEKSSYPSNFVEYTNSSSILYSTKNDSDGIYFTIMDISYTNGGVVSGIFSGSIKTADGKVVAITEGKFNVKFAN